MGLDFNALRVELRRTDSPGGSSFLDNFVKMPEGEGSVTVRLLPPTPGTNLYCATRTHKMNDKNFHCLCVLVGDKWQGNCPVCDKYRKLWKEADQAAGEEKSSLESLARSIKPLERFYYNCIVREIIHVNGTKEQNVGPKILSVGKQLHQRILRAILGDPSVDEPELGDVTDENEGRDFKIIKKMTKQGPGGFPNYDQSKFMNPSSLGTAAQIKKWKESLHNLSDLRQLKTYEELIKEVNIFSGVETDASLEPYTPAQAVAQAPVILQTPRANDDDEGMQEDDFIKALRTMN